MQFEGNYETEFWSISYWVQKMTVQSKGRIRKFAFFQQWLVRHVIVLIC